MADGIPCKHCGHQETTHELDDLVDPGKLLPGYKKTLRKCHGYSPENPKLAKRLKRKAADDALKRIVNEGEKLHGGT